MLTIRNLVKTFPPARGEKHGRVLAVDDISLDVEDGELFTLLGPSGCGKTTTLRCVAGLESPDRGEIALIDRVLFSSELRGRVERALATVKLDHLAAREATDLSGGQQQRLALARALVLEPPILLLDEPLSNLDAKLREEMVFELKRLQRELGLTAVYVTHDQLEALAMSNRVAVMRDGKIEQVGRPREIYEAP